MKTGVTAVLLVEDDALVAATIQAVLREQSGSVFEVKHVHLLVEGLRLLDTQRFDVILLDLGLPDSMGLQTLERVVAHTAGVPIVVLTALNDEGLGVAALKAGAQDYLVKAQGGADLLVRAIRHAIQRHDLSVELTTSHARQQTILEQNRDGIIIVDWDGVVLYLNPAAEQILGLEEAEVLGKPIGLPIGDRQFRELEILQPDGHVVAAEKMVADILWEGIPAYLASLRDITERKQHEETQRLLEAKNLVLDELNELNEMKSQFIEVVTHEMRTPMTAVLSSVGLLMDGSMGEVNAAQKKFLEMISRNIDRLARFTSDVLSLSRLDGDKYKLYPQEISLRSLLTPVVGLLDTTAQEREMSLKLEDKDPGADVKVFSDVDAVSQVVTNLVSNAMAHCDPGTDVTISWQELPSGLVEVMVSDTGPGIAGEKLTKIFDRFYQVHRKTGPGYKGTGIGLSICKVLVEKMGGRIRGDSTVGEGTCFRFTLPGARTIEDFLFGKLAKKMEYVTAHQLQQAVELQHTTSGSRKLGQILQQQQLMSIAEVDHVLHYQRVLLSRPHHQRPANVGESMLGRMTVKYGYLTEEQLNHCARIQEMHRSNGREARLGQILVEQGHLTMDDVIRLLKMQHQDIAGCPGCASKYNITRNGERGTTCPNCGNSLEVLKRPDSIEVCGDVN